MKHKKLSVFIVIAVMLILCALVFFYYSMFVSHLASYNVHRQLQSIYESNQSARSLTLSKDKFEELLHWAEQDEKRWRLQLGGCAKLLFYSAVVLMILAIIQIILTRYVYRHINAVPPGPTDAF
ncbi:MAG: hypothetical protein PVG17_00650 [Desulfobacterales bacterium]|jgi:phosphotransferase system  glucose/maltose/N-acetylglucosamine-specific IIC component